MSDRFFIAPYNEKSGQQNQVKPWLIPDEAFEELTNAYVFRGRVRKRFGSTYLNNSSLLSRLRINIGTTNGSGNFSGFVPRTGTTPIATPAIGQQFSVGTEVFTVVALGTPAALLTTGASTLATFNTTTGALVINGATASTDIYYYPALPVMGLLTYENADINNEFIIAFDTRFAYEYNNGWQRLATGSSSWAGSNSQFFWGTTWSGTNASDRVFFVTNFDESDPNFMRRFTANTWTNFRPAITGTDFLNCARIIVPFKNRLVAFNTWEGSTSPGSNYVNRCRYSQIGSPLDASAWRQDIPGRGNAIDAPTSEAIVTVEFIKDRLIVFFERSTWELVYTGNQAYPFTWQQINTELGAESTFSIVPFDKVAIGVGNVGIHACNGANVERIDTNIPDEVFQIHNTSDGIFRVYGIRDYFVETLYWTFPDSVTDSDYPFPNKVLVYNYTTGTWAFNKDTITCFGYFQPTVGVTWSSTTVTWSSDVPWTSGANQSLFRQVIAGNQQGYTFICDSETPTNASVLDIANLSVVDNIITITSMNHNLRGWEENYVYLEGITGSGNLNLLNDKIFKVQPSVTDLANRFIIVYEDELGTQISGTYSGGGLIARVSNIVLKTKQYNFYAQQGRNAYIPKVDFMVDATPEGQIQVDFYVSTSDNSMLADSQATGTLLGTGTLETFPYTLDNGVPAPVPFEENATRLWHPVYFQGDGQVVQFKLSMNDSQMRDIGVRECGFELHAICIHAMGTSSVFY